MTLLVFNIFPRHIHIFDNLAIANLNLTIADSINVTFFKNCTSHQSVHCELFLQIVSMFSEDISSFSIIFLKCLKYIIFSHSSLNILNITKYIS